MDRDLENCILNRDKILESGERVRPKISKFAVIAVAETYDFLAKNKLIASEKSSFILDCLFGIRIIS